MKSKGFILVAVLLAGLVCMPGTASADFTLSSVGTYWSQPGTISFDRFDTYFTDTATFSNAVVLGNVATIDYNGTFNAAGWTGTKISGTVSQATGPAIVNMAWDYNFSGTFAGFPIRFDINYFKNGSFLGHEGYTIVNQTYTGGFDQIPYAPVPIPPTVWMLGAGLMGMGLFRKRIKK